MKMNPIIKLLFSSEVTFPNSWEEDAVFGTLSETVQMLSKQLHSAEPELWEAYQKQAEALHDQERQMEFERGFLMAVQIMSEVLRKMPTG